ncbi:glycoside hydrolase family 3 C-terminal domain-containing protein [Actinocorallia sp. API 0066]|uniref:beta-glucosidase family protein n=1 Tax=Actinocorallia sp. API 0066 TaxID=2896846 RepID=UPI001E310915|nr:glycoside hydrolase family 3 C-terminal domain-containing protein [Actinocorallia sp. API 0066]MCD0449628.1 glycoside hydrolase family 3 C-terminal domain-containing protein [Actinocorallia sp. API 0066]
MSAHEDELLEARARMLAGHDMWSLAAEPALGFPGLTMSDGPIGVRGVHWSGDPSVALPSPTALAATWDTALARRVGALLAQEARRKGVQVLLAPTVNLQRSPLGGRHFECLSEDPLLTGRLAAQYVAGVQEGGVAVTVKHFVANDFETERMTADVVVSERALRELYLLPFEIVVKEAAPWGVMAAYNGVNGTAMSEHGELVNGVLRGEWGFDGFVVSDWFGARDTVGAALGGLDVAMPGPHTVYGPALAEAVRAGKVPEEVLAEHVARVGTLAERTANPPSPAPVDGAALAREVAARSVTLLRNDGVLPLAGAPRIALIGGLAKDARVMGGGSAQVTPERVVSAWDGLRAADLDVVYARGADPSDRLPALAAPMRAVALAEDGTVLGEFPTPDGALMWVGRLPGGIDPERLHTVVLRGTFTPEVSGAHLIAAEGVGEFRLTVDGEALLDGAVAPEGDDPFAALFFPAQTAFPRVWEAGEAVSVELAHRVRGGGPIPFVGFAVAHRDPRADADALIDEAVAAAAVADAAVVVVGTSKEVESEGFDRTSLRLPGRQDELVARVAAANPRTIVVVNAGSPVEMPWREDVAALLLTWFPGQEGGHALADVLTGAAEPGGRLPTTWPAVLADCPVVDVTPVDGTLRYDEGVFVGYPAWQKAGTAPAFEFGSGLGYTTWAYESAAHADSALAVTVRNTGTRRGREVVQVYLSPAAPDPDSPARRLAGFAVAEADPGATATVTIPVPDRAYARWRDGAWHTPPGDYLLHTGRSLTRTPLTTPVHRP